MDIKKFIAVATAILSATAAISGCAADSVSEEPVIEAEIGGNELSEDNNEEVLSGSENNEENQDLTNEENNEDTALLNKQDEIEDEISQNIICIMVTADNVNIRSGAGTGYSSYGKAENNTLYALCGEQNGWYKTYYKNQSAYIYSEYCQKVQFTTSDNPLIEAVIEEGTRLLGTTYVYGAMRLHDGNGNFYKGFTLSEFDCSSLMQYIFYYGADYLLQVNTRTQIYQGTTVTKSQLERGDLMFFTNSSRYNNTGIERVGHVALYLGNNYILHTSSDYAKIEKMTEARWNYFIQGQRVL